MDTDRLDHKFLAALKHHPHLVSQALWLAGALMIVATTYASPRSAGHQPDGYEWRNLNLIQIKSVFAHARRIHAGTLTGRGDKSRDLEVAWRGSGGESPIEIGTKLWPLIRAATASEKAVESAYRGWRIIGEARSASDLNRDAPPTRQAARLGPAAFKSIEIQAASDNRQRTQIA